MAMMDRVVVFFDLETTGLDTSRCDILQLAAISDARRFNVFISPCRDIDEGASRVNGFTTHGHGSDPRSLRLHGQPVDAVPLMRALTDFIDFLSSFQAPLLLAAHNARVFDQVVLTRSLRRCSLVPRFLEVSNGGWFLDTLKLSRELWSLNSHKLKDLVSHFLNMPFNAHDAQEDVRVLQELYMKWRPNQSVVQSCTFSPF